MPKIQLQKPYKISQHKLARYSSHYSIPAEKCLLIPVRSYEDEVACDVRWEDDNGVLHLRENLIFSAANIERIDALQNMPLYELWQHYEGAYH